MPATTATTKVVVGLPLGLTTLVSYPENTDGAVEVVLEGDGCGWVWSENEGKSMCVSVKVHACVHCVYTIKYYVGIIGIHKHHTHPQFQ